MNFTGRLTEISKVKVGKTKKEDDWASLDIEVTELAPQNPDYPQIAMFSYFKMGEYVKMASEFDKSFKLGDEVDVEFNFKCNKYTKDGVDKKFYKLDAWKVTKFDGSGGQVYEEVGDSLKENEPDDLPF